MRGRQSVKKVSTQANKLKDPLWPRPPHPPNTGSDEATALCPCKHTLKTMYRMCVFCGEGTFCSCPRSHLCSSGTPHPPTISERVCVWLHEEEWASRCGPGPGRERASGSATRCMYTAHCNTAHHRGRTLRRRRRK